MLAQVAAEAAARKMQRLIGLYIPTAKNGMVADHYKKLGFRQVDSDKAQTTWALDLADYVTPALPLRIEYTSKLAEAAE